MYVSRALVASLALALVACQALPTTKPVTPASPKGSPTGGKASPAGVKASVMPAASGSVRMLGASETLVAATLIGKVKLLSDSGGSLVSNNSGSLLSDAGASLISDKGLGLIANNGGGLMTGGNNGALIANNGGGLIGKTKYALKQAPGTLREAALTEAIVEVLDGAGRTLVDAAGVPLRVTTDATGAYRFEGQLPAENLVLRVRVGKVGTLQGGELRAIVPNPGGAEIAAVLDVDTPATLGATYVLETYVKGRADVFAKLPAREADALKRDMGAALQQETAAPAYEATAITGAVDALKGRDAALGQTLGRIESILLLGQQAFGQGLKATDVPLTMPLAVVYDAGGDLLIGEAHVGRIRRVKAADGTSSLVTAPRGTSELGYSVPGIQALKRGPDGKIYVADGTGYRVLRLAPGARPEYVAGSGVRGKAPKGGLATATDLIPTCVGFGADGMLFIGDRQDADQRTRLMTVDAQGQVGEVPTTEAGFATGSIHGLAIGPDGTIWVAIADDATDQVTGRAEPSGRLARKLPGGAWTFHHAGMRLDENTDLLWTPGGVLVSEDEGHRIWKLDADMNKTPFAGSGRSGFAGDGGPASTAQISQPAGLTLTADGRVVFADRGNALVRAIAPDGTISTLAGQHGLFKQGDGSALAVNNPFGLVLDARGDLLLSEGASHTIKRFDGQALTLLAGTERGNGGDGGPATSAGFDTPGGLAIDPKTGTLFVADFKNDRLRRIAPDGTITTVAGVLPGAVPGVPSGPTLAPPNITTGRIINVTLGPDGLPTFSLPNRHQVVKLRADGQLQLLAGVSFQKSDSPAGDAGDNGPALGARFASPQGLAYDQAGNLYIADLGNGRVRRVTLDGNIETYAGLGTLSWLGLPEAVDATTAKDVALALPLSLAFDAAGNLFVGELGTRNLRALGFEGAGTGVVSVLPAAPSRIRKITPAGVVTIVAGPGGKVMTDPEAEDALVIPSAILVKPDGSLVVSDPGTNQVRLIPAAATR